MQSLLSDLHDSARELRKRPGFTLTAVLALGVGATSAVFSVIDAILINPFPYASSTITLYLIGTGWLTARRSEGETSRMDWVVLLIPLTIGILTWENSIEVLRSGATSQNGVPVGMSFFMGSICLLAAVGDVRMLLRGGVFGVKRIARHLWRLCFGLFIAAGSFFMGPSNRPLRLFSAVGLGQHLPSVVVSTTLYLILTILPLVLLIFWLARVRFTNALEGKLTPPTGGVYSPPT
jgi:hypothetical protein